MKLDEELIPKYCVTIQIKWAWGTSRKVSESIPGRVTGDFFRSIRQVHVGSASKNEY